VWKVCEPDALLTDAHRHAEVLAAKPISSLIAVKEAMVEPTRTLISAARAREDAYFAEMMGAPANAAALAEFTDRG
jgi:enoyl-CoA hydratase/carnithine racemase